MPNYLSVNAQYTPVSFDEMIKPLSLYKNEYERQEALYDALLESTQTLADLGNSSIDSDVYNRYTDFQGRLNSAVDNLLNNGQLDARTLGQLRREYITGLSPYEAKLKRRNELIRNQASEFKPGTIYDIDYTTVPLKDINESSSYRKYALDDIASMAANRLSSQYIADGNYGDEEEDINNILSTINHKGLSEDKLNNIVDSIRSGRNAAIQAVETYNRKAASEEALEQQRLAAAYKSNRSGRGGGNGGSTKSTGALSQVEIMLSSTGEKVKVYKDKEGNYYKDSKGTTPVEDANELSKNYNNPRYAGARGVFTYNEYLGLEESSEVPQVDSWKSISNISDYQNIVEEYPEYKKAIDSALGGKEDSLDLGWFANGYIFYVGADADGTIYIKRNKNGFPEPEVQIPQEESEEQLTEEKSKREERKERREAKREVKRERKEAWKDIASIPYDDTL